MIFKIKGASQDLFKVWAEYAKQQYPDYLFQAREQVLIDDVIVAFAKGLEFVWRHENTSKRITSGWSLNAFLDFATSTLNTHWSQEYIYKQTSEYKELAFLRTLSQFLKIDITTIKKLELLYSNMMKKELHLIDQDDVESKDKIIDLNEFKKNKKSGAALKKNIIDYLDSLYYEKHFLIFGNILKNKSNFLLADFFSQDEVEKLIECVKN